MKINYVQRASQQVLSGGKPRFKCVVCGTEIRPGMPYKWVPAGFRSKARIVACGAHSFRRSHMTNSNMSEIYVAVEGIEDLLETEYDLEELKSDFQTLIETVEGVKAQYEEAAENFGGAGPNQERAEELDSFIDTLNDVDFPEEEHEFDHDAARAKAEEFVRGMDISEEDEHFEDEVEGKVAEYEKEWDEEHEARSWADDLTSVVEEAIGACP